MKDYLASGFIFWLFWVGAVDIFCIVQNIAVPENMDFILAVAVALVAVLLPPIPSLEEIKKWVES